MDAIPLDRPEITQGEMDALLDVLEEAIRM